MRVREWMSPDPVTIEIAETVRQARERLAAPGFRPPPSPSDRERDLALWGGTGAAGAVSILYRKELAGLEGDGVTVVAATKYVLLEELGALAEAGVEVVGDEPGACVRQLPAQVGLRRASDAAAGQGPPVARCWPHERTASR